MTNRPAAVISDANVLIDYISVERTLVTHKSATGTYHAFAIDIGCYAHLRKLEGKFTEIDVAATSSREKMRSAPILTKEQLEVLWSTAPNNPEDALRSDEE